MGVWVGRRKKDNLAVGASGVSQAGNVQGQWFLFFFFLSQVQSHSAYLIT